MWHTQLSRRELIELCLGGIESSKLSIRKTATILVENYGSNFDAYWAEEPTRSGTLPSLIVAPDDEESDFLTALNASPSAPTPFTAFCRVMPRKAAMSYARLPLNPASDDELRVLAVVSMVEAVIYSEGRLTLKTVSPAACRRTASFAWARAVATGIPHDSMKDLAQRWRAVHSLLGQKLESEPVIDRTNRSLVEILEALLLDRDELQIPSLFPVDESTHAALAMMRAIRSESALGIERAWRSMASLAGIDVTLDEVAAQSREERGSYLQLALKRLNSSADRNAVPACAFLATQVAPRSLEHLDILRGSGVPAVALWYAFFAALQDKFSMLQLNGWMGFRVLQDIRRINELFSLPDADIGYDELNVIARAGLESISRKLGHAGEVEVEVVPNVTASFTFNVKSVVSKSGRDNVESQLPLEPQRTLFRLSTATKEQIYRALSEIANAIEDPRDEVRHVSPQTPAKRAYRKKG